MPASVPKNIVTLQWIKRLKLCMVTMATLPPAKELKVQVVSWQNEIRTLDVLKSPTWFHTGGYYTNWNIMGLENPPTSGSTRGFLGALNKLF